MRIVYLLFFSLKTCRNHCSKRFQYLKIDAHRELSRMVLRRCAMVSTVQWANSLRMVLWMRSSVSRSTAAVASSRMSMRDFRSRARAKQSSCLWPRLVQTNKHTRSERFHGFCILYFAENIQMHGQFFCVIWHCLFWRSCSVSGWSHLGYWIINAFRFSYWIIFYLKYCTFKHQGPVAPAVRTL